MTLVDRIRLRPVESTDLPRMFELQCDPESNRMAVMNPRTRDAFDAHWAKTLDDPQCLARAIVLDNELVGLVSCFPMENEDRIGYWVDRAYWGQGIANRALQLLLLEVTKRPLVATVATTNAASLRVLQKNGFVLKQIQHVPARERYPACEEATLVLGQLIHTT